MEWCNGARLAAVIPAYNEEVTVGSVVLLTRRYVDDVIVVDDGSNDNPATVAEPAGAYVIHLQQNGGKALFAMFGTPIHGGHHNSTFDADETVMRIAAEFYAAMQKEIAG